MTTTLIEQYLDLTPDERDCVHRFLGDPTAPQPTENECDTLKTVAIKLDRLLAHHAALAGRDYETLTDHYLEDRANGVEPSDVLRYSDGSPVAS